MTWSELNNLYGALAHIENENICTAHWGKQERAQGRLSSCPEGCRIQGFSVYMHTCNLSLGWTGKPDIKNYVVTRKAELTCRSEKN